jgi:hypothetical protein
MKCDTRICFTEVRFSQTYSPLRRPQRPGLFQPFPLSNGPSDRVSLSLSLREFPKVMSLSLSPSGAPDMSGGAPDSPVRQTRGAFGCPFCSFDKSKTWSFNWLSVNL